MRGDENITAAPPKAPPNLTNLISMKQFFTVLVGNLSSVGAHTHENLEN